MSYGPGGIGKDGNRKLEAGSPSGNPAHMPDAWAGSISDLGAPQGQRLGEQAQIHAGWQNTSTVRQALPGTGEITPREQYNFESPGEPGHLGQDTDDYGQPVTASDPQRPNVPSPEFSGESGTTNMGPQGAAVDFNSVGPLEYPDFPMSPPQPQATLPRPKGVNLGGS